MLDDTLKTAAAGTATLENVKGDIISQTLDKLRKPDDKKKKFKPHDSMSESYNLSKSVLSAVYEGKGSIIDSSR